MPAPTTVHFATYNTQFCTGLDGVTDVDRIAREVGAADVIAFQEIDRFWSRSGTVDQAAELARCLSKHHWVYGPGTDQDASQVAADGTVTARRRQFGNMVFSRWPILSARNHMLPKLHMTTPLSIQRAALEAVIAMPDGPCRVVSTHLAHASGPERLVQIDHLLEVLRRAPDDGSPWSGRDYDPSWAQDGPPTPSTRRAVVMGDFNMLPGSPEYDRTCGPTSAQYGPLSQHDGLNDAWVVVGDGDGGDTIPSPRGSKRIDYVFVTGNLVDSVRSVRVDSDATGSDHWPVHMELAIG